MLRQFLGDNSPEENVLLRETETTCTGIGGCPGVPVHEGIPFVFITIHGVMTQFVNVSFFCVPVHEDTTRNCHWKRSISMYLVINFVRARL